MEEWLNSKLEEACIQGLGGLSAGKEMPLAHFGLERLELGRIGLSDDIINNIYRTLYVNSVGFFTKLDDYTSTLLSDAATVKGRIWNAFNVLIQYACPTEFKNITVHIMETNQRQLDFVEGQKKQI